MKSSISKIISAVVCLTLCVTCFCAIPAAADTPVNVLSGKTASITPGRTASNPLSRLTDGKYHYRDGNADCTYAQVTYGAYNSDALADHCAYFEYSFDDAVRLNSVKLFLCSVETAQWARDVAIDVQLEDGTWKRVAADYNIKYGASNVGGTYYEDSPVTVAYMQYKFAPVDCVKVRITSNRKRMRINKGLTGSTCVFRLAEIQAFYDPGITTYSGVERPDQADYAVPMPELTNYASGGTVTSRGTPHASNGLANLVDGDKTNRAMSYYYQGTTTPTDAQCINYYDITFADAKEIDRVDVVYSKYADDDRGHREKDIAVDAILSGGRYVRVAEKHDFTAAATASNGSNYTLSLTFDPVEAEGVRISANCKQTTRYTAGTYNNILQGYAEIEVYNDPNVVANTGMESVTVAGTGFPYYNPTFTSHSLVLAERIGVNFFMDLFSLTTEEKAASYMTFAVTNCDLSLRADFDSEAVNASGYYRFTCPISSVEMAETIIPTFHYGDGLTMTGSPFSVKDYIDYVVANSGSFDSSVVTLVKALGDYGHYAQIYFGNKNSWTAGEDYTVMPKYRDADYTSEMHAGYASSLASEAIVKDIASSAITRVTYNLNFDTITYVNVKMMATGPITASATVNRQTVYASDKGGYYQLRTPGLPIAKLGDRFTVTGSDGENSFTVTLSGLSYIRSILNQGSETYTGAKNAVAALYDYYIAATDYINYDENLSGEFVDE